ncbi:MAG: glycogen synthase, partial [Thermoanaerobaculia bacterium]
MKITHIAAECAPFAKTGGLGDVVGSLPIAQAELGHDVSVWLPLYRHVWQAMDKLGIKPEIALDPFTIDLGFNRYQVGVLRVFLPGSLVPLYLVGSDPHFDRAEIYSNAKDGSDDGIVRYSVFVRAAMEGMKKLWQPPDVLHAHDWHTALAPMALRWDDPKDWVFNHTVSVLTIHNASYQGMYGGGAYVHLGLPRSVFHRIELRGAINLLKGGVEAADAITAVSPNFARELMTPGGGFGLNLIFARRWQSLIGIVNGIDPKVWNPKVDSKIPHKYSVEELAAKRENRRALLQVAGMNPDDPGFVVGAVGRLTEQKGYDMLFPVMHDLV